MLIFVYNLILLLCLAIALPVLVLLLSKNELKRRLAMNEEGDDGNYLWFHCASVGEVNAIKPLISRIKEKSPHTRILMTTMTMTGLKNAESFEKIDKATLLPFDLILLYKKLINRFQPKALIIVETEIWFSLLSTCKSMNIPVMIVNGRISDKSFSKYLFFCRLLKDLFQHVSFVGAQSEENKKRYQRLGFQNVHNTHNLKFCTQLPSVDRKELRKEWQINDDDFVLVWGSSREGEEEFILTIDKILKKYIPKIKIIIAPRHINRLPQIKELLKNRKYELLSNITHPENDFIVIDSIGKLHKAYAIADVAVVGGSFLDHGGHNPLEPLYYEVPTIIGGYHDSCSDSVDKLVTNNAIIISNKIKLVNDILYLHDDPEAGKDLGKKGKQTILDNACSVGDNLSHIEKVITIS